jgi:sterol desaturase/sphingolipid hydroxylase (fatty acid hydroxylase superfamily)
MKIEVVIRLSAFIGVLGLMASWELLAPRRLLSTAKFARWAANLSIVALDSVIIRLVFAAGAVGAALVAFERDWGALNHLNWPLWVEFVLSVVILDFVLYVQHVMFHAVPLFWRFHMMHHADLDCDVTTGLRFHPVEVVFSMLIKLGAVVLIGAAPTAVLVFEIVLNATSMFNHSNVWMSAAVDRVLRWILVTPDMHRIHHSTVPAETNSNFGFNLPWWDRLLGTYRHEPSHGQTMMVIGLEHFRDPRRLTFIGILLLPFLGTPGRYPLLRKDKGAAQP